LFDKLRGPRLEICEQAIEDGVGLASWDKTMREHFLAVSVEITTDAEQPGQSHPLAGT
jgi:hypothetical protein